MDHAALLLAEDDALAHLVADADWSTPVPTCPGWTLLQSRDGDGIRGRAWTRSATAADDTLPRRLLETPLELGSGRTAALTEDRLRAMVRGYYAARGWDGEGRPDPEDLAGLRLDLDELHDVAGSG
mgnify:CR=1 FL=1